MKWIVGLGNPGPEYARTRHSAGFLVVDQVAQRHGVRWKPLSAGRRTIADVGTWAAGREAIRLVKPLTMMNGSGEALALLTPPIDPAALLIVCDDTALPLGMLRIRPQGGNGGHNGLASCLAACGTEQVARLRVGIGLSAARMPDDLVGFVLAPFAAAERPVVDQMLTRAVEACELWVEKGLQMAMNHVNPVASL